MKRHATGPLAYALAYSLAPVLALLLGFAQAAAAESPGPRYADAVRSELEQVGILASCENEPNARFHCSWSGRALPDGTRPSFHAVYSDASDTVYFYIERYLQLPPDGARTSSVLRRMMELNWELLVAKFEWDGRSGEVRLSALLNTDSNFDRRAFRSILRALDTVAQRYQRELRELAAR